MYGGIALAELGYFLLKNRSDIYQKAIILSIHDMRIKYAICS